MLVYTPLRWQGVSLRPLGPSIVNLRERTTVSPLFHVRRILKLIADLPGDVSMRDASIVRSVAPPPWPIDRQFKREHEGEYLIPRLWNYDVDSG